MTARMCVKLPEKWFAILKPEAKKRGLSLSMQLRFCIADVFTSMNLPNSNKNMEKLASRITYHSPKRGRGSVINAETYKATYLFLGPDLSEAVRDIATKNQWQISDILRALLYEWFDSNGIDLRQPVPDAPAAAIKTP